MTLSREQKLFVALFSFDLIYLKGAILFQLLLSVLKNPKWMKWKVHKIVTGHWTRSSPFWRFLIIFVWLSLPALKITTGHTVDAWAHGIIAGYSCGSSENVLNFLNLIMDTMKINDSITSFCFNLQCFIFTQVFNYCLWVLSCLHEILQRIL